MERSYIAKNGKQYRLGLVIGRFQPFHLGHKSIVDFALKICGRVIIGIGSSQESGTSTNPFDVRLRKRAIEACLKDSGVDMSRVIFSFIPDFHNDDEWLEYIKNKHHGINVVISGNDWVKSIFERRNVNVVKPPDFKPGIVRGTVIRDLMKKGERWEHLVPKSTLEVIERNMKSAGYGNSKIK